MFVFSSQVSGGFALVAAIPLWVGPRHQPQSVSSSFGKRSATDTDTISSIKKDDIASNDFMFKVREKGMNDMEGYGALFRWCVATSLG
jgi:hypothetical protein